ncbi:MAG: hypothetical protein AABW79_04285 [Nanoarchaeota archaeon]
MSYNFNTCTADGRNIRELALEAVELYLDAVHTGGNRQIELFGKYCSFFKGLNSRDRESLEHIVCGYISDR